MSPRSLIPAAALGLAAVSVTATMLLADEQSAAERVRGRSFPSVFQAWNGVGGGAQHESDAALSRHDLVFHGPEYFGLEWAGDIPGLAAEFTSPSRLAATACRRQMLQTNPNLVLLAELRYRDAPSTWLPENHAWWKRENGDPAAGWKEGGFFKLDYANPEFRRQVARQAAAVIETGVVDGIMLDWWRDDDDHLALIREIRESIGDEPLILVNANDRQNPRTAPFVNGLFMECPKSKTPADWATIAATLAWAEQAVKPPRINCLETWWHRSRNDLELMRMTTTLSLVLSDGYCLFSDPNPLPTPDHLHDWYPFWDVDLGRPRGSVERDKKGTLRRQFDRGLVVYNPPGNRPATITLQSLHRSAASGVRSSTFRLYGGDGDIYFQAR